MKEKNLNVWNLRNLLCWTNMFLINIYYINIELSIKNNNIWMVNNLFNKWNINLQKIHKTNEL